MYYMYIYNLAFWFIISNGTINTKVNSFLKVTVNRNLYGQRCFYLVVCNTVQYRDVLNVQMKRFVIIIMIHLLDEIFYINQNEFYRGMEFPTA